MGLIAPAILFVAAALSQDAGAAGVRHLRPGAPELNHLMSEAMERSATFRQLVSDIENSTIIVFVRFGRCDGSVPACLHILSQRTPERVLRITVDPFGKAGTELIALLGHELAHAAEIATDGGVVDSATFKRAYEGHGRRTAAGYETDHAKVVARVITRELTAQQHD